MGQNGYTMIKRLVLFLFRLYFTTENTKDWHKVHKISLIDYILPTGQ